MIVQFLISFVAALLAALVIRWIFGPPHHAGQ